MSNWTSGDDGGEVLEPVAARWNASSLDLAEITMDRNFALLVAALGTGMLWLIYMAYYNARLLGFLLTRLVNKFYFQHDNFKIGSISLNALSGKIMFRDIVYITYDYTLRIQDGYLIFRWWRSYIPKDVSEDLSHSDTRVSLMLNGFELHVYNRSELYADLERTFGLEPSVRGGGCGSGGNGGGGEAAMNDANEKRRRRRAQEAAVAEAALARTWRDLVPVIKADVCSARVVFGNRLVPTTLSVSVEEAHLVYSTKPPASSLDHLMHFVKAKADNCKVLLAPSPNYTAMVDDPPRYMGEGFVIMSSNYVELYFYMDEPGLVPERPVLLQLANGDVVESAPPIWGIDIKCGKGTDFSYGPWADRQRDHLFKFFFPPDYKNLEVTPQPKPGDRRQVQSFDIRLSTLNEATIDILFTKNKETNAVHINVGAGSYLEVTLPWIVLQDGYTTKITGQLLHVEATTSLQYRSLAESETLEYTVKCHYPLVWNHHQCWQLALTGCKATVHFVYTHIDFFQDLVNDWASKARPDLLHFVPYTWKISLLLKECELLTLSNQHNWIDCSSTNQENNHIAFCGDLLDLSFDLPFIDFLPDTIPLKIWVQGEAVDMSLYLPEVNTNRLLLLSIDKNMKLVPCRLRASKWRRKCVKSQGWVDCWSVPIVALSVRYAYHPLPPLGPEPQADITTPEKEEILLSPMRIPRMRKPPAMSWAADGASFDRTSLPPDRVSVELEVGPSVMLAYGTILTGFMNLLENIFGEDQTFTDMQKAPDMDAYYWQSEQGKGVSGTGAGGGGVAAGDVTGSDCSSGGGWDPRRARPLDVTVCITLHDVQAHLMKNCSESEPPCPVVLIERLGFEMDKSFRETKLQLLLSPSMLVSSNNLARANPNQGPLYQGHLMLSSLQLRGHGFFSDAGRGALEVTIEYAWMLELQLGQLTGRLTLPQLYHVASALETLFLLVTDDENELCPPDPARRCHHGLIDVQCPETDLAQKYRCPTSNEIKYKMVRVAVDLVDVCIADTGTALQVWASPARLTHCNLAGAGSDAGLAALLPSARLALYTQTNLQPAAPSHSSHSSSGSQGRLDSDSWLCVGSLSFGPLLLEAADALPQTPKNLHLVQQRFLKFHDEKTRRLWFLWPNTGKAGLCGCLGGCAFFGSNRNGPAFLRPSASDIGDNINVANFHVIENTPGEFGYGQSLLHVGQLVFHTPPYGRHVRLSAPRPDTRVRAPPAHVPAPAAAPARRSSYTSAGKPASSRSEVPYARLVDSSAPLVGNAKIDSDSKLNKSGLTVPQLESSVSDSRLALSCNARDGPRRVEAPIGRVAVSDSHYSLDSQPPIDDRTSEVRRTLSITSENHSEAFFSADEEIFPSRSSSLKHSFGSRHSAHSMPRERASLTVSEVPADRWSASSAPRPDPASVEAADAASTAGAEPGNDSESGSVSSTSFISAISSQEDMTLVNLHMQTNKPIVDSPLLMASYQHTLPQYRCGNWSACSLPSGPDAFTLPLFRRADDGTLIYVGQRYVPHFEPLTRPQLYKLVSKKEAQAGQGQQNNFNSQIRAHPMPSSWWEAQAAAGEGAGGVSSEAGAHTASDQLMGIAVRLRGPVDVVLTPLVLEGAQRFVESLTPVLAAVHPASVLTHLRLACVGAVSRANLLKDKRHVLNWLPAMQARAGAAAARDERCKLATIPASNVYEEAVSSRLLATVSVPRLDIVLVQSAVVEDSISFSALDNIQDLTCVSLCGLCVENVRAQWASARRGVERVQLYYRPALRALATKKSFGIIKSARALGGPPRRAPDAAGEPVFIETAANHAEDVSFSLNVGKVHAQLRRLRNESSQLKDATITGIPAQHSKASFTLARLEPCSDGCDGTCCANVTSTENQKETAIGYIMVECAVEGAGVRVSRHAAQKAGEERAATPRDTDSTKGSVKSDSAATTERTSSRAARVSAFEELFRKKESASKPSTPNLSAAPASEPAPAPAPEPEPEPEPPAAAPATQPAPANTSSCSIDLKVVWFNFAAPPRTPITRKIDYTRLDWNLLSTAAPAINAWMNPCNRLGIRVVALYRAHARRLAAVAACLMAGALDVAPGGGVRSRYGRHSALARTLREEPSLALCQVLLRHALQADAAAVQADLAERHLPSLSTLRQGVIVLSRQWKNILYTPLLLEQGYRNKVLKPLNVTFALPDLLEDSTEWATGVDGAPPAGGDTDAVDENCLLLHSGPHHSEPEEAGIGSDMSLCSGGSEAGSGGGAPRGGRAREDLYQWMAKQEVVRPEPRNKRPMFPAARLNPMLAAASLPACSLYPLQGSLMLLDAHLVFQPLLAALGVSPHQVAHGESKEGSGSAAPALESLGSRLALLAWVELIRVDIVVSELGRARGRGAASEGAGSAADTAAFLCEKVCVDAELRRVADAAVGSVVARRRVLYISRGQLKRHISSALHFTVGARHISQQVNMPLLRLLHQISTMYTRVKEAQVELRGDPRLHAPPSSSASDFRDQLVSLSTVHSLDSKWELHEPPPPVTPTPSADSTVSRPPPPRARPQSFAQKLRSTSKSVKGKLGYSSLSEGAHTPMFTAPESTGLPPGVTLPPGVSLPPGVNLNLSSAATLGGNGATGAESLAPRCWRTLYLLLDLYAQMPDADTITHRFSVSAELPQQCTTNRGARNSTRDASAPPALAPLGIVVVGVAKIHRTRLLASLSGLRLEAELTALQSGISGGRSRHWALSGTLGRSTIVLLEGGGGTGGGHTVVRVSVGKSQALVSGDAGGRAAGSALLSVGGVRVELPQHPVALHGVMTRSSRQLSSTLQELGVGRPPRTPAPAAAPRAPDTDSPPPQRPPPRPTHPPPPSTTPADRSLLYSNLQFSIAVQSVSVTAALLPSLQAQYKMEGVSSSGTTGERAAFTVELPTHSLSFATRLAGGEANLPAAHCVHLPPVHVAARVAEAGGGGPAGAVLAAGRYLAATAEIGLFEHTLSTDLLNHLVFVQKVFMKEVNEVVQKVSGGEKPVPLWGEEGSAGAGSGSGVRALFSLLIRIQRIQLTATTPSNSAVRLDTGCVELELSNRVQNLTAVDGARLFARAQVDIDLSLGQLLRNALFEEAEPEFQQYAFFNTRISMRNAFADEVPAGYEEAGGAEGGGDVVLIRLKRPLVYIQPIAVDRAILVWLNYKNAYEYWNEKRRSLNSEVLTATQQLIEKVQQHQQFTAPLVSTLFLQLDVDDIGICLPLTPPPMLGGATGEGEARGAVVVTLESTSISACSRGALVSAGRFVGLCVRFAAEFEASLDDWKPRADEPALNVCCVSEGTYEVCSRTTTDRHNENAKWFLNVSWQMEGVDIHLDVSVGKQLSALGHTLTMLTGFEEEDPLKTDFDSDFDDEADNSRGSQDSVIVRSARGTRGEALPAFVFDPGLDARARSRLIEQEMHEQTKIIADLRALGASHATVEYEMRRLQELEVLVFKDFRRDMLQKLRRQSVRAGSLTRGKLGLGSHRSRSFIAPEAPLSAPPGSESLRDSLPDARLPDIGELSSSSATTPPGPSSPVPLVHFETESRGPSRTASLRGSTGASTESRRPPGGMQRQSSLPAPREWPDIDPEVELRRKPEQSGVGESGESRKQKGEPNIDFELDVKVHINSGKCVLHTRDPPPQDDRMGMRVRVGRSASGGLENSGGSGGAGGQSSPGARRKPPPARPPHQPDATVFRVPGLDLKVHYESKTLPEEGVSPAGGAGVATGGAGGAALRKAASKKAALFAWITLQSIPEETLVSPHILDFLEHALEPIPIKSLAPPPANGVTVAGGEATGEASYGQYVYASFPVDVIVHFHMQPSTFRFSCLPASRVECLLQLPELQIVFSSKRASLEELAAGGAEGVVRGGAAVGGLSVTGCLADFSVHMFHPYGKAVVKEHCSPLQDAERKDSLSINVEFVKFHLARSRKLHFQADPDRSKATVRFSTIVDVGSAWFKYDMRRLGEILAFPKAWYRRTIVRRMFLGDLSESSRHHAPQPPNTHRHPTPAHSSANVPVSPVMPQREKSKTDTIKSNKDKEKAAWETLVLFAVNFTKLNVHMNMGNVMGNVSWQSRDFTCSGRLSIGSSGHRNMLIAVGLAGSCLDARGGIVGGAISLSAIHTHMHLAEEPSSAQPAPPAPAHTASASLAAAELRLEYMGAAALLARVSKLTARARDEWLARTAAPASPPRHRPTARPALVLVHGSLAWHQLQVLMSRSTTPDLLKMQLKLEEFFTQQFKSSKRVFSSLHPDYRGRRAWERREQAAAAAAAAVATAAGIESGLELRHHRHWQSVLKQLAGVLPADGLVLGGTMELRGAHLSLACFHGTSFKAKSWALFSLKEPALSFATEAQQVAEGEDNALQVHVIQSLTAGLGLGGTAPSHQSMATVCRMTRALLFPPQFKTLQEWFHYAFASSEIDAIELFPSIEREAATGEASGGTAGAGAGAGAERRRGGEHTREVIFALPSLQLHLRTQHRQAPTPPTENDPKPLVECSFITEFEDHIFVSVDAEAFLFLHDLISSYIKEKDRLIPGGSNSSTATSTSNHSNTDSADDKSGSKPTPGGTDYRSYRCVTWHLEPTVRLLSWAGKSIEPYGVDYILQKLGFRHARTTIPKWLQRGSLDPLDRTLAALLHRLAAIVPKR